MAAEFLDDEAVVTGEEPPHLPRCCWGWTSCDVPVKEFSETRTGEGEVAGSLLLCTHTSGFPKSHVPQSIIEDAEPGLQWS